MATTTFSITDAVEIDFGTPDTNLDGSGFMVVSTDVGKNDVARGLMQLDVFDGAGSLPRGAWINSATLRIGMNGTAVATQLMQIGQVATPWVEGTVTWNSYKSTTPDVAVDFAIAIGASGYQEIDITEMVQALVDTDDGALRLQIQYQDEDGATLSTSFDDESGGDPPELVVVWERRGRPHRAVPGADEVYVPVVAP